jgi:hypothetical protein
MTATNQLEPIGAELDMKICFLNIGGHNNELLVWAEHQLSTYRPWLVKHTLLWASRLVAIRNFCRTNKEAMIPYVNEDEELLDSYTEGIGDFMSTYGKASPEDRAEYVARLEMLNEEFQRKVDLKRISV